MPALGAFYNAVVVHRCTLLAQGSIEAVCQAGQWDRLVGPWGNPIEKLPKCFFPLQKVDAELASVAGNQKTYLRLQLYLCRAAVWLVIRNVPHLSDDFAVSQHVDHLA